MNLAFNTRNLILALLLSGIVHTGWAQETPVFDELKERFESGAVFTASFTHTYFDDFTGESQVTEGTIWVGEQRYKIRNDSNLMVVNSDISRVYDGLKNRVIISEYVEEEDDFAPSRMLQGVDDAYSVTETQLGGGATEVTLISEDPFTIFMQVVIRLNESGIPESITAIDQVENRLVTEFEEGRFTEANEETFLFDYPADAEIIDLRPGS